MLLLSYLRKKWIFKEFQDKKQLKTDILSGLTVALALVPEAIAFSFVAGINPMVWLHAAFIVWLITAIFWGRPGMISGATWALAVVMVWLVSIHWIEYLFATLVMMWALQILFWIFKFGKFVRLIPHSVMLWFVNWLAIIIFMAQIWQFKVNKVLENWDTVSTWLSWTEAIVMWLLILVTMAIIHFLPKLTKALPSGLVAIVIVTLLVIFVPWLEETRTITSYLAENWYKELLWTFPSFHIPNIEVSFIEMLKIITPYAFILAVIGLTESLMTLTLIDEITETNWSWNKESIWQWIANTTCWFFWAMWGCAMIWQSMINISNWWRGRMSWISASIFLILMIVFATSYISMIPLAALVWLMFMVVIGTFAWPTIKMMNKIPRADAFVIITVTFITVYTWDLAIAVISWVIISALVFAWQKSQDIHIERYIDKKNITHYNLDWPLFFGSTERFKELFDIKNDTKEIIIDFADSKVLDHSAIEAINNLTEKYLDNWKILHLKHLTKDCRKLLKNAEKIVDVNILKDPKYKVADDWLSD